MADDSVCGPLSSRSLFSPEEIIEFQRLAKEHAGADLSKAEAEDLATRLLHVLAVVRDVQVKMGEPIKPTLDLRELTLHLRKLQHELELSAKHPSSWRWAIMSLHEVVSLVFAFHAPAQPVPVELAKCFDALVAVRPELPQLRSPIALLDQLRTKCVTLGVLRWPVSQEKLRGLCSDCLRVIQRLEPDVVTEVRNIEDVLQELR